MWLLKIFDINLINQVNRWYLLDFLDIWVQNILISNAAVMNEGCYDAWYSSGVYFVSQLQRLFYNGKLLASYISLIFCVFHFNITKFLKWTHYFEGFLKFIDMEILKDLLKLLSISTKYFIKLFIIRRIFFVIFFFIFLFFIFFLFFFIFSLEL